MLYYVFTVDGDWKAYFDVKLPEAARVPQEGFMRDLIAREIETCRQIVDGKFVHFIHTSPRARQFFIQEPFISLWKEAAAAGADVGVHCHEDEPDKGYFFRDTPRIRQVIADQVEVLRTEGLAVCSYRGGYMAFTGELIPVLEENGLKFDFSCEPGRYLVDSDTVVSDWRGSPQSLYQMSYDDYRKPGDSGVVEVPVGSSPAGYLYFEKASADVIEEVATELEELSRKQSQDIIVSVLTHSWEFASPEEIKNLEEKVLVLKQYGRFINLEGLSQLIKEN